MAYKQQPLEQNQNQIVSYEKYSATLASQATEWLMKDVDAGKLKSIPGYDTGTEIATAMLRVMQTKDRNNVPALKACTKESVLSAMRDMALQGLSMSRSQCYPIVYGNQLQIQRSYFGTISVFQRMFPNLKLNVGILYKGDKYEFGTDDMTGCKFITGVESSLEAMDGPIVAAYGSIVDKTTGEMVYSEVMTWKQIQTSWSHAKTDKVQKEFPDQMAKRTLINRMCKLYVNAFGNADNAAMMDAFVRTTQNEFEDDEVVARDATATENSIRTEIHQRSKGNAGLQGLLKKTQKATAEEVEAKPLNEAVERSEESVNEITLTSQGNNVASTETATSDDVATLEEMGLFEEDDLPEDSIDEDYDKLPF